MTRTPPSRTPEEEREWYAQHAAVLNCALRHLAAAWHRKHATSSDPSWVHCTDRFCRMAHDAAEGRYEPATRSEHSGVVVSIKPKGA